MPWRFTGTLGTALDTCRLTLRCALLSWISFLVSNVILDLSTVLIVASPPLRTSSHQGHVFSQRPQQYNAVACFSRLILYSVRTAAPSPAPALSRLLLELLDASLELLVASLEPHDFIVSCLGFALVACTLAVLLSRLVLQPLILVFLLG
jgi:hypothetical protein